MFAVPNCPAGWTGTVDGDPACHCHRAYPTSVATWGAAGVACSAAEPGAVLSTANTAADKDVMDTLLLVCHSFRLR